MMNQSKQRRSRGGIFGRAIRRAGLIGRQSMGRAFQWSSGNLNSSLAESLRQSVAAQNFSDLAYFDFAAFIFK